MSCIEGANGAGKTTLLEVLAGLVRPTNGWVGVELDSGVVVDVGGRVGWVGHESGLYRDLTVGESVALSARLRGATEESCDGARARLGLGSLWRRRVGELSRGQRQRVAVGCALVHGPEVLLLDEGFSGMDSGSRELLEQVLAEESGRGGVVVVSTHDTGLWRRVAGRRLTLEAGRLMDS